jgi:hypothetical protein
MNMTASTFSYRKISALLCILFVIPQMALSQQEGGDIRVVDTIDTSIDLFTIDEPMNITLTMDMKKYKREEFKGDYMDVDFLYEVNDTLHIKKSVRIKPRGVFRRNYCSMAPFWLNIRKADVANEHLQDVRKMKVVTRCKDSKTYDELVLKEFLAYKIYNILSPVSFRVRLIRMRYVDTGKNNKTTEGWAFLIEPEGLLAERLDAVAVKRDDLAMALMKPADMDRVALFMYLIGNTDYSVSGRHNVKILGMPGFGSEGYTPVPYDFDIAGIVDAYYANPREGLGITSVTERYFQGPCRSDAAHVEAIEHINQYREEILALVTDFEYLDSKNKKKVLKYLEDYFALAANERRLINDLKRTCR